MDTEPTLLSVAEPIHVEQITSSEITAAQKEGRLDLVLCVNSPVAD